MATMLHILTRPDDPLPREIIERQRAQMSPKTIEILDLTGPSPDYSALLQKLFAAESVAVW
jgi:hypothetical protein